MQETPVMVERVEDLSTLCRVCLQEPEESELLDLNLIYDEEEQLSYCDCFTICTRIDLTETDCLPRNLCRSCGLELQMAYDFKKKVEISKTFLSQYQTQHRPIIVNELEEEHIIHQTKLESIAKEEYVSEAPLLEVDTTEEPMMLSVLEEQDTAETHGNKAEVKEEEYIAESTTLAEETLEEQIQTSTIECCDELEEHLEFDPDYSTLEELDEEDGETIQIKIDSKSDGSEYLIETISTNNGSENTTHTTDTESTATGQNNAADIADWQQAVQTVVSESHLPLHSEHVTVFNYDSETAEEEQEQHPLTVVVKHEEITQTKPLDVPVRKRYSGKFTCDFCHKLFPNHSRMLIHRRSHETDRPKYPCVHCGRVYATKQAMDVHIRTVHTKTAGFACPICDKMYAIRKGLEVHMRYHTGTFPYVCDLCGKKFAQMCHLKTHKNVKHNSVRFCCEHPNCGKFFTSSASLRNHEFSHGDMPFECAYCKQGYPAKAKLKVHIRRKHGKEMSLDQLEDMRKFHVARGKLNMVKLVECED